MTRCLDSEFVFEQASRYATGIAQKTVPLSGLRKIIIPLPPVAEEHRIVAKVDELMALCDELEAAQAKREARRDRLVAAAFHGLNNGDTDAESNGRPSFTQSARFYLNQLPRLTTRPEHIHQLRQTILNLAVRGKLVPQDPEDEPASELLNRIRAERRRLEILGRIRKPKFCRQYHDEEVPYLLPENWKWAMLTEITDIGTGSTPTRTNLEYWDKGDIAWITSGSTSETVILVADEYVTPKAVKQHRLRLYPAGTLLVALYGQGKTRGQVSILGIEATVNQACAAVCPISGFEQMHPYLKLLLEKNYDEVRLLSAGGAQPNLNVQKIKEMFVPIPPITEQHRIVSKVDELMALCDELETQLTTTATTRRQLLEATLHEALAGK